MADFYDIKKQIMDRSRAIRLLHGLSDIGESATNYSLMFFAINKHIVFKKKS